MTHSFFANMGGFVIETEPKYAGEKEFLRESPPVTLNSKGVLFLAQHGLLSDIRREIIEDKSKADYIGKSLAILQGLWLVIQCIARLVAHLPITQLEIITLGHVFCALMMYAFWWHKPLDIKIPLAIIHPQIRQMAAWLADASYSPRCPRFQRSHASNRPHFLFEELSNVHREMSEAAISQFGLQERFNNIEMISANNSNWDKMSIDKISVLMTTIPYDDNVDATSTEIKAWLAISLLSSCYGGLHVAAWFSLFPTALETLMWRLSSVCVASAGFVLGGLGQLGYPVWLFICALDNVSKDLRALLYFPCAMLTVGYFAVLVCFCFGYACSRGFLIIEAFISLRRLPVTAYSTPEWTQLITHL